MSTGQSGDAPQGPFLAVATFCERAIEDREGIFTLVRLFEELHVRLPAEYQGPTEDEPFLVALTLFIALKAIRQREQLRLELRTENPRGVVKDQPPIILPIEPGKTSLNVVTSLTLGAYLDGWYWFEILLEGQRLTRIPLHIAFERVPLAQLAPGMSGLETLRTQEE